MGFLASPRLCRFQSRWVSTTFLSLSVTFEEYLVISHEFTSSISGSKFQKSGNEILFRQIMNHLLPNLILKVQRFKQSLKILQLFNCPCFRLNPLSFRLFPKFTSPDSRGRKQVCNDLTDLVIIPLREIVQQSFKLQKIFFGN